MGNEGYYFASQPPLDPLALATQFGLKPPVQVAAEAGMVRGGSGTPTLDAEDAAKVAAAAQAVVAAGKPPLGSDSAWPGYARPAAAYVGWDAGAGGAARAEAAALRPKPSDIVAAKPSQHVPTLREQWTLPTGTASVNRGIGTGGKEWLQEQVDPSQLHVSADGAIEGPPLHQDTEGGVAHAGNLFMGAGTQADLEGKMNLQAILDEEAKRRAARSLTEAQAEDPFGIGVAQQKANIEYLFGTGRDVAKAEAESRGAQAVEAAKGAAKFAGSDLLVSQHDLAVAALKDPRMIDPETKGPITPGRRAELLARVEAVFNSQYELHKLGLTSGYPPFQFPPLETKTETPATTTPPVATPPRAPGT
jgi:surface antigen